MSALGEAGLAIINYSNMAAPIILKVYDTPGYANKLWLSGDYIYVSDGDNGMLILNVDPSFNITVVTTYDTPGSVRDLYVGPLIEDYRPVSSCADGPDGLRVLDQADINNIVEIGHRDTAGLCRGVWTTSPTLFSSASGDAGLHVINVHNVDDPVVIKLAILPVMLRVAMHYGGVVYVGDGTGGLRMSIEISRSSFVKSFYDTPGLSSDFGWYEGIVLIADYSGLRMVNSATMAELPPFELTVLPE